MGQGRPLRWVSPVITKDQHGQLRTYLLEEVIGRKEVRPETLISKFPGGSWVLRGNTFLEMQDDDTWWGMLYAFLGTQSALWEQLKTKKFIVPEIGELQAPFRSDGSPAIFLPPAGPGGQKTVKATILDSTPEAREFLENLKLHSPHLADEVSYILLPEPVNEFETVAVRI